ncbi:MAG: hypothetical protein GC201_03135 [Alphaproteobacteria bacterium]|nr:hypothetical protein [Alphaproteobacteria bacterium]
MREPAYKSWAGSRQVKPRCRLCQIVLVRGRPPSSCHRAGCRFAVPPEAEEASPIPSSLGGGDYSEGG